MCKKLTAIDYLVEKLNNKFDNNDFLITFQNEIEQAKSLEKKQIIGIYTDIKMKNHKLPYGMKYLNKLAKVEEDAEQYYNNNFKQ